MLSIIPLMIIPLIVYNIIVFYWSSAAVVDIWQGTLMSLPMLSGAVWHMTLGDLMVSFGLFLLFFEILKSTRTGSSSIIDHLLSTFVFIAFLVEFLVVGKAAHAVFFILMIITLVDVVAGFTVSIRSATRDISVGGGY